MVASKIRMDDLRDVRRLPVLCITLWPTLHGEKASLQSQNFHQVLQHLSDNLQLVDRIREHQVWHV